jgi:hypothetical protein
MPLVEGNEGGPGGDAILVFAPDGTESTFAAYAHGHAYSLTDTNRNSYTHSYTNAYANGYNNTFVHSYGNSDFESHFHAQSHPNVKIEADIKTALTPRPR